MAELLNLKLNGVSITLLHKGYYKVLKDQLSRWDVWEEVIPGFMMNVNGFSRGELYRAAGYDTNKIDFAVPQPWIDENPEVKARWRKERAVWSYEDDHWGKPVWDSEAWKRLRKIMESAIRKGEYRKQSISMKTGKKPKTSRKPKKKTSKPKASFGGIPIRRIW